MTCRDSAASVTTSLVSRVSQAAKQSAWPGTSRTEMVARGAMLERWTRSTERALPRFVPQPRHRRRRSNKEGCLAGRGRAASYKRTGKQGRGAARNMGVADRDDEALAPRRRRASSSIGPRRARPLRPRTTFPSRTLRRAPGRCPSRAPAPWGLSPPTLADLDYHSIAVALEVESEHLGHARHDARALRRSYQEARP